ncbi:MAG: zinc ribbon domain-containing protein [Gemmatimonadaceae bacterium]
MMLPWVLGAALAVLALAVVLLPLFSDAAPPAVRTPRAADPTDTPSARAIAALREVEFDRATGKLSDGDYAALKAQYTDDAVAAMRAEATTVGAVADEEVEAAISRYRIGSVACATCGPRPEPDAIYCSTCGRCLAASCSRCGSAIAEDDALFCSACGERIAA